MQGRPPSHRCSVWQAPVWQLLLGVKHKLQLPWIRLPHMSWLRRNKRLSKLEPLAVYQAEPCLCLFGCSAAILRLCHNPVPQPETRDEEQEWPTNAGLSGQSS